MDICEALNIAKNYENQYNVSLSVETLRLWRKETEVKLFRWKLKRIAWRKQNKTKQTLPIKDRKQDDFGTSWVELVDTLEKLTFQDRTIVELRMGGYSLREISPCVNLSVSGVCYRLGQIKEQLTSVQ